MAYNKRNRLERTLLIQEIYIEHSRYHNGNMTNRDIYRKLIWPVYKISERCFENYLDTNARKELKELEENEAKKKQQEPTLFG